MYECSGYITAIDIKCLLLMLLGYMLLLPSEFLVPKQVYNKKADVIMYVYDCVWAWLEARTKLWPVNVVP